jgi:FkbM family methyltransferase
VEVVPAAVSNVTGHTEIEIRDRFQGSTIVRASNAHLKLSLVRIVPVTTIDDFCADRKLGNIDFIKMDIEGAEEAALLGGYKNNCEM